MHVYATGGKLTTTFTGEQITLTTQRESLAARLGVRAVVKQLQAARLV